MDKKKIPTVRMQKIELSNFKNVENGFIEFKNNLSENTINNKSEILGIYGQNGSGKTALIDAGYFIKLILAKFPLPEDLSNYINVNSQEAKLVCEFYISINDNLYFVNYEINIKKANEKAIISFEKLSYSKYTKEGWSTKTSLIEYNIDYDDLFTPKYKYSSIISNKENLINLKVAQKLSFEKRTSMIFNDEVLKIIEPILDKNDDFKNIMYSLSYFSRYNLFVIPNNHNAFISMNMLMPFSFRLEQEEDITSGDLLVRLDGISFIPDKVFKLLKKIIKQMNIVLSIIIPSLKIELHEYGEELDKNGTIKQKVELLSIKDSNRIPMRYESEGIKKIISILSALIAMYNNISICMIIDEMDSGIYEFLLGEILKVLDNGGKGQLIFTSHNLRPLEILTKESIYFTTTNAQNRYIHFNNVKPSNNLRSLYLKSINLGGQKENLYSETDELEIRRAFRMAGDEKKYDI